MSGFGCWRALRRSLICEVPLIVGDMRALLFRLMAVAWWHGYQGRVLLVWVAWASHSAAARRIMDNGKGDVLELELDWGPGHT